MIIIIDKREIINSILIEDINIMIKEISMNNKDDDSLIKIIKLNKKIKSNNCVIKMKLQHLTKELKCVYI